jgi:hypothetical protein
MYFKDLDQDGIKEIYIPTKSQDSTFLNIQEHGSNNNLIQKEVFVDVMASHKDEYEYNFHASIPFNSANKSNSDLYFGITNGYSGNPRNVYKYDYKINKIIKSPHLTNSGGVAHIIDLDNDNKNEILIAVNAAGNTIDSAYTKRSDYSVWLTVLDDDLDFMFDPIEFKCIGAIQLIPVTLNDSLKIIADLRSYQNSKIPRKLMRLSAYGKIEKENVYLESKQYKLFPLNNNSFGAHDYLSGNFSIYNNNLEKLTERNIQPYLFLYHFDIDADQEKEWIGINNNEKSVTIFRSKFKDQITINRGLTASIGSGNGYGLRQLDESTNLLYFQNGSSVNYYNYGKNPNYYYAYLAYLGIYGLVLGILLLVVKGQKIVEARKRAIEQEISKLQLKTIKNQVDSHFVFNAINTIGEMTLTDNKLEADKFIGRFSGFMRETLNQSDKISTTLKDELDYTDNFIRLQQIRFNNSFDYKIEVDEGVNKSTKIPKHVLFTYVENAIKHGLAYTPNGLLKITATKNPEYLLLAIEDNGGGIEKTDRSKKHSTGSGLKIMDDIFELYSKLYKRKISHKLIELIDAKNNKTGIRVEIKISRPKK